VLFRSAALALAATSGTATAPASPRIRVNGVAAASAPAARRAAAPVRAVPALWKVSDSDTTIYLFGTIHLLPKGLDWYHGKLAWAFEHSQVLITEIPEVADGQSAMMMIKHGTLPPDQNLRSLLNDQQRRTFEAAMTGVGLPAAAFDRFKPWFAAVALATLPLQKSGYEIRHGVENELAAKALALRHPRIGLETLDYQLGLFDSLPTAVQARYLAAVIEALPTIKDDIGKMVSAWAKGNAVDLAAQMNQDQDDPELMRVLLVNRNQQWAKWIAQRLKQPGRVFIAVGAGHLGGPDSVQVQLEKVGISAPRVQ